jgi:lipopolysaccharide transport system ATP-binding protein
MPTVISVENLSKAYRLGQINTGTFTYDLQLWWARLRGKPNPLLQIGETDHGNRRGETIWALKDVSFTVEQGEVLGIIGRNGAGKSTLLKILSRVTAPTSGRVRLKGRVASLLEVGTGFHPELTGRENIYLNGAILGMSKAEVTRKFDEIVDFAEVEQFIDTPVKRYSSGMYVRLAFAVAAHLEPEILVVDEVLAVGDAAFQKKCLGKMGDVAKAGRTVLFVSHNMTAVSSLCQKGILLSQGKLLAQGPAVDIVSKYLAAGNGKPAEQVWPDMRTAPGNHVARLHALRIYSDGSLKNQVESNKEVALEVEYWKIEPNCRLIVELRLVESTTGYVLETFNTPEASGGTDCVGVQSTAPGLYRARCTLPPNFLNDKHFSFHVLLTRLNPATAEVYVPDAISFEVMDTPALRTAGLSGKWMGPIRTALGWKTEFLGSK